MLNFSGLVNILRVSFSTFKKIALKQAIGTAKFPRRLFSRARVGRSAAAARVSSGVTDAGLDEEETIIYLNLSRATRVARAQSALIYICGVPGCRGKRGQI